MRDVATAFDAENVLAGAASHTPRQAQSILPISVRDLAYTVGAKQLVKIDRLTLTPGAPTIILGPNGAGKSLLLRLMHGLIEPTTGEVLFGHEPMNARIRRRQAMVFQRPVVLRRSVRANVDYALAAHGMRGRKRRKRLEELLEMGGLAPMMRQAARSLSGGEQQRLALVRAVAAGPELLFLDEPTSSLDPGATQHIEALVHRFAESGMKIVMVTHDIGQARRLAGEVVFMHRGHVVEQSPAAEFFDKPKSQAACDFVAGRLLA